MSEPTAAEEVKQLRKLISRLRRNLRGALGLVRLIVEKADSDWQTTPEESRSLFRCRHCGEECESVNEEHLIHADFCPTGRGAGMTAVLAALSEPLYD